MADVLEIHLGSTGGRRTVGPATLDFKRVLAPLVNDLAAAAAIEAGVDGPAANSRGGDDGPLLLALSGVRGPDGAGAAYDFKIGPAVEAAVGQITAGLAGRPGGRVVPEAARHVHDGLTRAIRRGLSVRLVNGVATPVFSAGNPPPLIAAHPTREFDTEIAVKLLWVGGKKKASARVELHGSGQVVTAQLTGPKAARELGGHLYRSAVLAGRAVYVIDPDEFFRPVRLLSFRTSSYRLLEPVDPDVLFDRLAEASGGVWDDTDPTRMSDEEEEAAEGTS